MEAGKWGHTGGQCLSSAYLNWEIRVGVWKRNHLSPNLKHEKEPPSKGQREQHIEYVQRSCGRHELSVSEGCSVKPVCQECAGSGHEQREEVREVGGASSVMQSLDFEEI